MSDDAALQILKRAREIISRPTRWTKFKYFTNTRNPGQAYRDLGTAGSDSNCAFCATGALMAARAQLHRVYPEESFALKLLTRALPPTFSSVVQFNDADSVMHPDVLQLFDRAIAEREEGRG